MDENERKIEAAIARMTDGELEVVRRRAARDDDHDLLKICLERLTVRALPVLVRVCHERGRAADLDRERINLAVEEATARLLAALGRIDSVPPVNRLAAETATACVEAQAKRGRRRRPRLAPVKPELRLVGDVEPEARSNGRRKQRG
jgi:hypothetical protein